MLRILLDYNKSLDLNISGSSRDLFHKSPLQMVHNGNIHPRRKWTIQYMKEMFEKYQEAQI